MLSITSITASGNYSETNNCASSLAAGAACTITVTFAPTNRGNIDGSVTILDNVSNSPQVINLTGSGSGTTTSTPSLSPASLSFGSQAVGTTSASQSFTIKNTGTASLTISNITATGDFTQSGGCVGTLASHSSCVVTVTFTPSSAQAVNGAVTIADTSGTGPHVENLSGTGVQPVTLAPASLNFREIVGSTSSTAAVTLTNNLPAALPITAIKASGGYTETNNCGTSLPAGQGCTIAIASHPQAAGPLAGTVAVINKATNSPQIMSLIGTGLAPTTVTPTSLNFPAQKVGTSSAPKSVTLTNNQSVSLSIGSIVVTGDFSQTNTCGSSLVSGGSCAISVTFTPTATGTRGGTFVVLDGSTNSPEVVKIAGTGD